ncbi:iron ABC transporter substrate-binding protein [Bacteroidia bacterium]|nr:iron ABC transporter substrate-binding protein [Bacteroidia bacterium]
MVRLYLSIISILILVGCNSKPANQDGKSVKDSYEIHYAKGFQVKKFAGYTEVSVVNPWDTTKLLQKYILVKKDRELPAGLPKGTVVRVPLSNVAAYNAIHCSTLKELASVAIVKGVCEPQYIKTEEVTEGVKAGSITDLGMASNPDVEKIIMLSPDAILTSPISGQAYGSVTNTNIPIIETPDYTEPHPLGRAEWIRFYSLFIDKEQLADSLFNITVTNYNNIKKLASEASKRPAVFTDMRYMGSWNMPGGKSYMANMLADGGGDYLWADDNTATFLPLSFEAVLDRAGEADVWLIRYFASDDITYNSLEKEYKPYSYFRAFKEKNIYGCNTSYSTYYDDLPIHPDYILQDFAKVFHPDLFPDYQLKYYKALE